MRSWDAQSVASAAGATLLAGACGEGPAGASVDTRTLAPGELFVGIAGEREDGGEHAAQALGRGAWGVLVTPLHARALARAGGGGVVLEHPDPLAGLQALAGAWRRALGRRGCKVLAVTGSAGKTSTKDILAALLGSAMNTLASRENYNTEIGLPLSVLAAGEDTEALVLEMGMRGPGQIARLTEIAGPDVGVIVSIGPAHLELLGSLEAIAAAKAELIAGLAPGASVVVPAGEPLLAPHLRADLDVITFGEGGEVTLLAREDDGWVLVRCRGERLRLRPSFAQAHNLSNLLAAIGAASAVGVLPSGPLEVSFSSMRGQRHQLPAGGVLIEDCYNANPVSMRAAIADLVESAAGRTVAVLGDMLELGPQAGQLHRELGAYAGQMGVSLLVAVGPLAAEAAGSFAGEAHSVPDARAAAALMPGLLHDGDTVLLKGSRGVGLELVAAALLEREPVAAADGARAGQH